MKSRRAVGRAVAAAVAFAVTVGAASFGPGPATPAPPPVPPPAAAPAATNEFTVLLDDPGARPAAVAAVEAAGGRVVRENTAVAALVVQATPAGFVERIAATGGVFGASRGHVVGSAQSAGTRSAGIRSTGTRSTGTATARPVGTRPAQVPPGLDPLDAQLWGLRMIGADAARAQQPGDRQVLVGILDTGVDGSHPDLAPNFDAALSRNFVTDIPVDATGRELDGPCEFAGCVDPADHDGGGHGTHVAGTVAAAANGTGLSGVAPGVRLVNIRAGQDGGLFFLQPVVDALTYGADIGLDVINMSFYVDPWRYNCLDNPADSPEARIEQRTIIEAMTRALEYAHGKGVTLIGSLGNENEDLGRPATDTSSPNFPPGTAYARPVDNANCLDLPVEGPHVIGVSAVGPAGTLANYSNFGVERISVAAPGGSADSGGIADLILSTYPRSVLEQDGAVDAAGEVTPLGAANGVQKACGPDGCGYYTYLQGTSMAAPHVTGVAALVVSQHGAADPQHPGQLAMPPAEVERALVDTARQVACPAPAVPTAPCEGAPDFNGHYGHGIVDAVAALAASS